MGNEIMRILKAAFVGVGVFALESFATDAPLFRGLYQAFADAGKFIFNTLKEAFLQAGTAASAWVKLAVAALRMDLPAVGLALAELKYVHGEFSTQVEKTSKSYSDIADDAMAAAEASYKNKENFFDTVKSQKELNELIKKQNEEAAKHPEKPATATATAGAEGAGVGGGGGSGGVGGASWKAKMAPIIDPASINTGLYKNTQNSPLGFQADLAAASVGVQKNSRMKSLESQIQDSSSGYNPEVLSSLLQQKAELQQNLLTQGLGSASENQAQKDYTSMLGLSGSSNQQDILTGLSRKYSNQGFGLFEAKKLAEKDYSAGVNKYKGNLSGSINKTGGPNGNGTSSSSSGGGGSSSDPMAGIQTLVKNIYDYMKQSLPQHALS